MSVAEIVKLKEENRELRNQLHLSSSYRDRFNMIIDDTYEWVWEVDARGVYTYASKQVTSVLGYLPEELIGKTPFDFMSKDEAERVGKVFGEILSKKESFSKLTNMCIHKDGHSVHTETSGQPIYDYNGNLTGYRGIDFDRTKEVTVAQKLQSKNSDLKKALHNEHELLLNVTNTISDLLFYKDTDYRYTGCNQAFSNFLGLPIDFIVGKTDYELFSSEFADLFRSKDKRVIEGMESYSNYEWVNHADGRRLYLLTQKSPLFNTQANLIGMVGIARDLTKEHILEEQLKESKDFLIDAQNIAKVGHWDWDIPSGKLFWSDQIYKIFGYQPQEFGATYDAFLETIHPDDRQMVAEEVDKAVQTKAHYDIFHRILLPDGKEKIVHEIGHAIYDEKDQPVQMIGTVQDVTQITNVQKELTRQKEAFEKIFEHSSDGTLLIEGNTFIDCNHAIVEMFGASNKKEILQMHLGHISPEFQPDGTSSYEKSEKMMEICQREGRNSFEWVHSRTNGEEFWAEVLLTRIEINNRSVIHASVRDITDRKFLENTLETSNMRYQELVSSLDHKVEEQSAQMIKQSRMAQMGELLSMIAHQWRQPLSSISTIASAIKIKISLAKDDAINEESGEYLHKQMNEIETFTQALSNTINDFRTLYKPDKIMKYSKLNTPVDRALKLLDMSLTKDHVIIEKAYGADLSILMHENEIMQVILNLLKNAEDNFIDKETKEPCIKIETRTEDLSALILISDNGGGIEPDIIENIFDPYFSTKHEKNGTGLGLYMSKIIIEQHHKGKLDVYNTDQGVCFAIELIIQ